MKIAVGSKNPVKIKAVQLAFERVWSDKTFEVVGKDVDSGVSAQPMSLRETVKGARNRAKRALKALNGDFGIGLEGGIFKLEKHYFDGAWIVIIDKDGREGIGSTVHDMLSKSMMKLIKSGKELGEVDDIMFDISNSKQGIGHFGLMTKNVIPRTEGYRDGVIIALARFIHPHLYEEKKIVKNATEK